MLSSRGLLHESGKWAFERSFPKRKSDTEKKRGGGTFGVLLLAGQNGLEKH